MKTFKNFLILLIIMLYTPAFAEELTIDTSSIMLGEVTFTVYVDGEISNALSDTCTPQDTATATAPAVTGKTFNYWTNGEGDIVSYNEDISLIMYTNTILNAVYSTSAATAQPAVGFLSITGVAGQVMFNVIATAPSGKSISEYGVRYSTTKSSLEDLKGTDDVTVSKAEDSDNNWLFYAAVDDDTTYYAVAYAISDGQTYYSDVKTVDGSDLSSGFSAIAGMVNILFGEEFDADNTDLVKNLRSKLLASLLTIDFDANNGNGAMTPQGALISTATTLNANTFTRSYYDFTGWNTKADGTGTSYDDGASVTLTASTTLYAQWKAIDYAIRYELNGGEASNPTSYNVESEAITLANPTRAGYTFTGWTGTELEALTESVTIPAGSHGDREYAANWNVNSYTITYELNGGTNDDDNPTSYTIESATITLKAPTREGYGFKGWTENGEAITEIAAGSTGDRTLTATWSETGPEISPAGYTLNAVKGQPASLTIYASGVNLEWSMNGTLPAGLAFSSNENSASITGTPELGTSGSYACTITAKNDGGSAAANVAITITSDVEESGDVEVGDPVTTTTDTGASMTTAQTVVRNGAGSVVMSADIAITAESTDLTVNDAFSTAISIDVTISLYDKDYDSYSYSMDIAGLPEWITVEGELASTDKIAAGTTKYHYDLVLTGTPLTSPDTRIITLNAYVTISGDTPALEATAGKDINIFGVSVIRPADTEPEDTEDTDTSATAVVSASDIDAMDEEELRDAFENKTNIVLTGEVSDLSDVLVKIGTVTTIENLDLSQVVGLTEVKFTEEVSVKNLSIAGNTSIKTVEVTGNTALTTLDITNSSVDTIHANGCKSLEEVNVEGSESIVTLNVSETAITSLNVKNCTNLEMVDASGCSNLEDVNLEGCESLTYLNVNETSITSLNVQNCTSLDVLYCASCDISDLNIDGCDNLSDVDVRNNSLRMFNAIIASLRSLECRNQTIYGQHLGRSMNFGDFLRGRGRFAKSDAEDSIMYTDKVENLKAYDAEGNEISAEYDTAAGEAAFGGVPARITYDYDTGFENIRMDVTVYAEEDESEDTVYGSGPGETGSGGCSGFGVGILAAAIMLLAPSRGKSVKQR